MRCLLLIGLWLGLAAPVLAATAQYRLEPEVCAFAEKDWFDPARMRCGTVIAYEPGVAEPIRVPALRLLRRDPASRAVPVVFVNGGPGGRGVADVGDWLAHPLLQRQDLVLFDARGTGLATPALCSDLGQGVLALIARDLDAVTDLHERTALVHDCLAGLPAAQRAAYSSAHMARDIDAIRRLFGDEKVSLYAVSYGTRVAQAYAVAFPQHLERRVLDSVVPDQAYYPTIAPTFEQALARVFTDCEQAPACHARFPHFRQRYGEVAAALGSQPIRLAMPGGRYPDDALTLNAQDYALLMQQLLYGDALVPTLPLLVEALHRGNTMPLALLFDVSVGMRVNGLNFGAYYLVLGNDELPRLDPAPAPGTAPDSLVFYSQDLQLLQSLRMFDTTVPALQTPDVAAATFDASSPPDEASTGPALVLAGRFDPITAPAWGQAVARGLGGQYLELPASGHAPSLADGCGRLVAVAFLEGRPLPACRHASPPVAWAAELYPSPWPRNWLEAIVLPRSLLPLAWLGVPALLYALLLLGVGLGVARGMVRRVLHRSVRDATAARTPIRRVRVLGRLGLSAGIALLVGLGALLAQTVGNAAPALLLFGLPLAGYGLAGLALVFALLTALLLHTLVREWRHGRLPLREHLAPLTVAVANLGLIGFLLRWQVLVPA